MKYVSCLMLFLAVLTWGLCGCVVSTRNLKKTRTMAIDDPFDENAEELVIFPKNYRGKLSFTAPQTWRQFFDVASYHFCKGQYESAIELYLEGSRLANAPESKLLCILSANITALGANNTPLFHKLLAKSRHLVEKASLYSDVSKYNELINVLNNVKR